jgi:hypothetical protein
VELNNTLLNGSKTKLQEKLENILSQKQMTPQHTKICGMQQK